METLRNLRLEAGLSQNALAKLARVDRLTVDRAENGQPVQDTKAYAIVQALSQALGRQLNMDDVEGLNIL